MLYYLLYPLHKYFFFFNLFRYITFRSALACVTSFLIILISGPFFIRLLKKINMREQIRKEDSAKLYELHKHKKETPTMGGILILFSVFISVFLWSDFNKYIGLACLSTFWAGIIGFVDDYLKQLRNNSKGLSPKAKIINQFILGLLLGIILYLDPCYNTRLDVPFLKELSLDLGPLYILLVALVIIGFSNAVNLTDGLDGLAIGNVIMVVFALSVLSYASGHIKFSEYLFIPYIPYAAELVVFCASILGAGLGFLWFNCYPAEIFMGDVGSLSLGAALGTIAILIKKEILLLIVGGVFVLEAISVILQVGSFKLRRKRIFKIAPLHHHFQFLGWPENKIIIRFWIIAVFLALFLLITLKIR